MWTYRGLFRPIVLYAAIDPAGAGGSVGGAPGGAPTPNAQPGGQGGGQGGDFRGQFFPGVPDEIWSQVEPHVRGVQGHVTQLEQRYAPFKSYRDEDLQGLANYAAAFDRDPVGQWIRMAQGLQASGILDRDLDLDHLAALVSGQLGVEPPGGQQPNNGQPPQNGDMPQWAQQLAQRLEQLEGGVTEFTTNHRRQVEDTVLKRQVGSMKEQLAQAGFPEDSISEENLLSTYIAHRGNVNAAVQSMVQMRLALLKGFTRPNGDPVDEPIANGGGGNKDLTLPNGAPQARESQRAGRRSSMIGGDKRAAALQFLKTQDKP